MALKFFDELGGVITLRLKGSNPERLINIALTRGIYIWDLKQREETLQLRIRSSAFKALQSIAEENGYEWEIIEKRGLPFYKTVMKRRMGLLGGAVLFLLVLYFMSSFVWFIDVTGNDKVNEKTIIAAAARNGIYSGAAKWGFSANTVERAILREIPQLTYIQCDVRGVKVRIKVVEKILPGDEVTGPCHIVAAKDGIVEDILVLEGQANVKVGQVVGTGDILISGIVYPPVPYALQEGETPPDLEPYPVRARGTVKARIWYEGYGECPLRAEKKEYTGRSVSSFNLQTPWKKINLKKGNPAFAHYQIEKRSNIWHTSKGDWGIVRQIWREQKTIIKKYREEEAVELARERGLKNLHKRINSGSPISDTEMEVLSSPSDSIVRIKIAVECIEDISRTQAINVGEISN